MRILDTLEYARRLQEAGVAREHAEAHATVMSDMILVEVATKADLDQLEQRLRQEMAILGQRIDRVQDQMTIRLGAMLVVAVGVLTTLQRLL